jgi:8-oxo-dGTP pyrophosphatase MutT (NUDIX family)
VAPLPSLADIRRRLAAYEPTLIDAGTLERAAVALVLRAPARDPDALEVLLIERARHDADPWSGQIGLPGGRVDAGDADARAAAERETHEELALDLRGSERVGRLDDVCGVTMRIHVAAFVYFVGEPAASAALVPSNEVADVFWFPLAQLMDPARHETRTFRFAGREARLPAVDVVGPERPVLWGLTYRFLDRFLRAAGAGVLPSGEGPLTSAGRT